MTTTNFLGLTTNSQSSGSNTTFLNYRLANSDISNSNLTKIDTFATGTSASLTSLKVGQIVSVPATFISSGSYIATAGLLTSYQTNQLINLKLNANNPGATTLNINSLGYKYLKKVDNTNTIIDLVAGDLLAGQYNLFTYDGTQFVWTAIGGATISGSSASTTGSNTWLGTNQFGASVGFVTTTISSNTTLDNTHYNVLVDATSASRIVTLPSPSSMREYTIKKVDSTANIVQIIGTIDNVAYKNLSSQYASLTVFADTSGSKWWGK